MTYSFPELKRFTDFIVERHAIYVRRAHHTPRPWTKDPILRDYKFTNVYRELDRVTQWIAEHWRNPNAGSEHVWFGMVMARLINHIPTLDALGYPGVWNRNHFVATLSTIRARGEHVFGGAYIITTAGQSGDKVKIIADHVLTQMWRDRDIIRPRNGDTLMNFYNRLVQCNGFGSFMAAQIVADMKYTPILKDAPDWWTFAASGPGSRRGLSYVIGEKGLTKWKEYEWRDALLELREEIRPAMRDATMQRIHAQDVQNCLCEYSKYRRTQLGTGRPKTKFTPTEE